ncbi:shikimate dehydrogenase [Desulfofustis glycolicus]|uniref:Shikimate dehydrogenase (NADP(+)) n=1 Tax=Desulfofustis glycolicus DSM 9705 TaxID=1121409 RepID=A0A1M5UJ09_9BACT|nr:shikimate dehydrogenase [Desulfofustis glycolicus]MCB2217461.1 shikimate dehydrogenase [Desulfobulbaceae bacterium]SHH62911.1 shikimate dehydrogenase [Desulfofustis glycolicus DSM 9705]
MDINGSTKVYGIIGNPVAHSLSPAMHNAAFATLGENRVYVPLEVTRLDGVLAAVRNLGLSGLSVTIPYKEAVLAWLDEIDPVAARIGAVNTIQVRDVNGERELFGTNTDWLGANRALAEEISLAGSRAVILGAGGAARAIGFGLMEAGAAIEIHSRTEKRGRALADTLGCPWLPLEGTESRPAEILINATSVGMASKAEDSPVHRDVLSSFAVVMDIVYSPLQTRLLREAAAVGCRCVDGLQMLLYQGAAQCELWTGRTAPVEVMRAALLQANAASAAAQ